MRELQPTRAAAPQWLNQTALQQAGAGLDAFQRAMTANYLLWKAKPSTNVTCAGGGNVTTGTDVNGVVTATHNACTTYIDANSDGVADTSIIRDGIASFRSFIDGFGYTDGITTQARRLSDNALLWEEINANLGIRMFLGSTRICLGNTYAASASLTVSGTTNIKVDIDADGLWEANQSIAFTEFRFGFHNTTVDANCNSLSGRFTRTSSIGIPVSLTDNIQPMAAATSTIPQNVANGVFQVDWARDVGGELLSLSGAFAIESSCHSTMISLSTVTPVRVSDGGYCSTAGSLAIDGDIKASISYTGTGGIEIDNGSDGTIETAFASCADSNACQK
jgi:hypothetical protein